MARVKKQVIESAEKQQLIQTAETLELMSYTLSLFSNMSHELVEKQKYNPENIEALLETRQGIGVTANGLRKLIAEQTLLIQTHVLFDNLDTSNDSKN